MLLTYRGLVNVTLNNTTHKYRNEGTSKLFTLIARFLANGQGGIPLTSLPSKIDLKLKTNHQWNTVLYYPIPVRKDVVNDPAGNVSTRITATIDPLNILPTSFTEVSEFRLELLNDDNELLAIVGIENKIVRGITGNRQALIEWLLQVINITEGASE